MTRTVRHWLHLLVAIPKGPERRMAIVRRAVLALGVILLISEAAVTFRYSGPLGLVLMASTAGLGAFVYAGLEAIQYRANPREDRDDPMVDRNTGLPTRQQLIDTLARDIARCERYSHALTLAVVRVSQFDELKNSWGEATGRLAIDHVSETLKRITRASDFLCRLDESCFAVVLLQCSGRQAALYADRVSLAVSNRPLNSASNVKVPLYVGVDINALEYDSTRFRGPLEFLSVAGGDVSTFVPMRRTSVPPGQRAALAADTRSLRQQLVKDYYPGGEMKDFADAYREARNRNRHAG
jgi:diguanylate cyclase (GGDEF)-like protein